MAYTTIDNPQLFFQCKIYSGAGGSQAQTLDGSEDMDLSSGGMVWIKCRDQAENHGIYDTVRGATELLVPHFTAAETTLSTGLTAFGSDGFTVAGSGTTGYSGQTYVAWCWKESATSGFDIIEFTGNATARNISHNLSAIPELIIIKNHSSSSSYWTSYHKPVGNTGELYLNATDAAGGSVAAWNSTTPDSSNFRLGANTGVNGSGNTIIAYVFAPVKGFSRFGSYKGNSNSDGSFIFTGFSPSLLMVKCTSNSSTDWLITDNKRSHNKNANYNQWQLRVNTTAAEENGTVGVDFLSNGFKWRDSHNDANLTGRTYIYMAFAHAPFVNSNGVPCTATAGTGGR